MNQHNSFLHTVSQGQCEREKKKKKKEKSVKDQFFVYLNSMENHLLPLCFAQIRDTATAAEQS